jgi:hypothetical protein
MRIALFTPFSPDIGGGSVQLRSHLAQLSDLDVEWFYLAAAPVGGEHRHWLGRPLTSGQLAADLSARSGFLPGSTKPVREIAEKLNADLYWVVAHHEGISVAAELLSMGRPVHLTVHDEPLAMLIVSRRFRPLWPFMSRVFSRVVRGARSVDVISTSMRDYFKRKYNVDSFAVYKYLAELPEVRPCLSEEHLTVGHIGKLYHPGPFRQFILACRNYAATQKRRLRIVRIGACPEMDKVCSENLAAFETLGDLLERDALPVLATCDFVYAMYPDGLRFQGFRRTSLPMKLSTYVQAQRPIFAHTPSDSGLAWIVGNYKLGVVSTTNDESELRNALQVLLQQEVPRARFEEVRLDLMGPVPLQQLRSALTREVLNSPRIDLFRSDRELRY